MGIGRGHVTEKTLHRQRAVIEKVEKDLVYWKAQFFIEGQKVRDFMTKPLWDAVIDGLPGDEWSHQEWVPVLQRISAYCLKNAGKQWTPQELIDAGMSKV